MLDQGYGIMPNSILFNKDLSDKEKLLYCLISSLCAKEWFSWATNQYLWEKLWLHKDNIWKYLSKMNKSWVIFLQEVNNTRFISICKIDENTWGGRWIHLGGVDENTYPIYRMNSIIEKDKGIAESEIPHIEEKKSTEKSKPKLSSSIRKGTKPIRAIIVAPKKELIDQVLGQKRWVDKLYEIITLPNMKDYDVLALQNPEDELSFTNLISLYEWLIDFFQEKYDWKIYKDENGKMVGSTIILNELDKFIAYYSENKKEEDILDLKARLRKWVTNSLKYAV
jgi:hypothetical protein